jgi:hypothetical protein
METDKQTRSSNKEGTHEKEARKKETMTTYAKGYQAGWMSYLEEHQRLDEATWLDDTNLSAGDASLGLTPQGDYWLGYHHGRAAVKTRLAKMSRIRGAQTALQPSPA